MDPHDVHIPDDGIAMLSDTSLSKVERVFKYIILGFNALVLIFACILISYGAAALNGRVGALTGSTIPSGLIVMGVFLLVVAILGAVASWKESRMALGVYFGLTFFLSIILFAIGIGVYVMKNNSQSNIEKGWKAANNDIRVDLQDHFQCCGLNAFNDTLQGIPCRDYFPQQPCMPLLVDEFNSSYIPAGACGFAFAIILVVLDGLIYKLMRGIQNKQERMQYSDRFQSLRDASF